MNYTKEEVIQFIQEEDVKFIRLAFCDVYGTQKNISIMAGETERAFRYGIAIDAWSVPGFGGHVKSDLFLHPDPSTLTILPWRPEHGRVVRMFCDITYPDGTPFLCDSRHILKKAVLAAKEENCEFFFGPEMEFYLFNRDEQGNPTKEPYDQTGYMDIAPDDKGENVRREICLTLEKMGIITGYHANVNLQKLGYHITAFINLAMDPDQKPVFYPFISACPNVIECNCVTGSYSMLIKVAYPSTQELDTFIGQLQKFGNTKTQIVFSTAVPHRGIGLEDYGSSQEDE